jgi:hypothetical protein
LYGRDLRARQSVHGALPSIAGRRNSAAIVLPQLRVQNFRRSDHWEAPLMHRIDPLTW